MNAVKDLSSIIAYKNNNFEVVACNDGFLRHAGLTHKTAIGFTDYDLPWQEYADLYRRHEIDALNGLHYSTIIPVRDHKNNIFVFLHNKTQRRDANNQVIGIFVQCMEIINTNIIESSLAMKNSAHQLCDQSQKSLAMGCQIRDYFTEDGKTLSVREQQCFFYLLRGKSSKEIAKILNISPRTAERHIENIKIKFKVSTKYQLIDKAIKLDLVSFAPKSVSFEKISDRLS